MMNYDLGLCCISLMLKERGIQFQTMTYTQFAKLPRQQAMQTLSKRIQNNFNVVATIVHHCAALGIKRYRLSSDLIPVINHPDVQLSINDFADAADIYSSINAAKQAIISTNIRTGAHPPEFISLTSDNDQIIANSIRDLEMHAVVFDLLDLPQSYESPLNIHVRKQGDAQQLADVFLANLDKCSDSVKKRLVLEVNDNKNGLWTISNLYKYFYKAAKIPVTYDNLHHTMIRDAMSHAEAFEMAYSTWPTRPVFHYSEGINGTRTHADYATGLPVDYGKPVDYEVELKAKDLAIIPMLKRIQAISNDECVD
jgi:UV DNA damage endonuclease